MKLTLLEASQQPCLSVKEKVFCFFLEIAYFRILQNMDSLLNDSDEGHGRESEGEWGVSG